MSRPVPGLVGRLDKGAGWKTLVAGCPTFAARFAAKVGTTHPGLLCLFLGHGSRGIATLNKTFRALLNTADGIFSHPEQNAATRRGVKGCAVKRAANHLKPAILTLSSAKGKDLLLAFHGSEWRQASRMTPFAFSWFPLERVPSRTAVASPSPNKTFLLQQSLAPAGWFSGGLLRYPMLFRRDLTSPEPALKPPNPRLFVRSPRPAPVDEGSVLAHAALHSLGWLVASNIIGIWLAVLLLFPNAGRWLGEWSYGRWTPVHLNWQLYGWMALPLVGWAIRIYGADRGPIMAWSRAALTVWSLALTIGAISWLQGNSSGKLFLDWSGFVRIFFPLAILFLWFVLLGGLKETWRSPENRSIAVRLIKILGLVPLLLVPFVLYLVSNPAIYPAVNPETGGPTGASQLESTLIIVLILLLVPFGLTRRKPRARWIFAAWIVFAIEAFLCVVLMRADQTHPSVQVASLASLLVWVPLVPAYFHSFEWPRITRNWRIAALAWWALLVPAGWIMFLPGILDRLKFTDGLVAHSILAMAGFATSLLVLILGVLLGEDGIIFNTRWAFIAWHGATLAYVILFLFSGWREGADPSFTIVPGIARDVLYAIRLILGLAMTAASAEWLRQLMHRMPGQFVPLPHPFTALVPKPRHTPKTEEAPAESRPFARFIAEPPDIPRDGHDDPDSSRGPRS